MAVADIDILRSAKLLLDQHGDQAWDEAVTKYLDMKAKGDAEAMTVWRRIAHRICALTLGARHDVGSRQDQKVKFLTHQLITRRMALAELDVAGAAKLLLDQHGPKAWEEAAAQAVQLHKAGDNQGFGVWRRIAEIISDWTLHDPPARLN